MKPNKNIQLTDSPRFRFVFISAMLGFVAAAWICAGYEIIEAPTVLALSLVFAGTFAIAGFGLHLILFCTKPAPYLRRQAYFVSAGLAIFGLVASLIVMNHVGTNVFVHLFFRITYFVMVGVLILFSVWLLSSMFISFQSQFEQGRIQRQLNYEEHMRRKARYKRSVDLNKQDYDTRLTRFVTHTQAEPEATKLEARAQEEPFVSEMPFWQRNTFQIGKLPKPVDLIRVLLHRISKAVYQGKSS